MRWLVDTRAVETYVEGNLCAIQQVEDVARAFCLSKETLRKHFRRQAGVPLGRYITRRRIVRMKKLLRRTQLTHREISCRVGYRRADTAAKAFKRETGLTMTEYRQEQRAE